MVEGIWQDYLVELVKHAWYGMHRNVAPINSYFTTIKVSQLSRWRPRLVPLCRLLCARCGECDILRSGKAYLDTSAAPPVSSEDTGLAITAIRVLLICLLQYALAAAQRSGTSYGRVM